MRLFPAGRDAVNKTPVFEVEANWPSGMSGGLIFNEAGNVIGVVSRSLAPDDEAPGVGYGACLRATRGERRQGGCVAFTTIIPTCTVQPRRVASRVQPRERAPHALGSNQS